VPDVVRLRRRASFWQLGAPTAEAGRDPKPVPPPQAEDTDYPASQMVERQLMLKRIATWPPYRCGNDVGHHEVPYEIPESTRTLAKHQ
jgi:hypothetical protein